MLLTENPLHNHSFLLLVAAVLAAAAFAVAVVAIAVIAIADVYCQ